MAHMLDFSKGAAAMAFAGETPWHRHGTKMAPETLRDINAWINASGFDFRIERSPIQYSAVNGAILTDTANHVLWRSDTGARVGIVSDGFRIVQPLEVAEFFRELCEKQGFELETMGVLKGGSVYWALARTGHVAGAGSKLKETHGYVLISTACDGSMATTVTFTAVRVVCWNTLSLALASAKGATRVRHSTTFDPDKVKRDMGLVDLDASWNTFREQMRALMEKPMSEAESSNFFAELLRPSKPAPAKNAQSFEELLTGNVALAGEPVPIAKDRAIRGLADLEMCYVNAPGAAPGTAYGALQAVTRFVDHSRGSDDKRLQSAWFGQGNTMKSNALTRLLDMSGYTPA